MSITYQEAIDYSHNYATAKPDIGLTEKEHIMGLCKVLESVGKERDALAATLDALKSTEFAEHCQECGIGQSEAWQDASVATLEKRDARMKAEALEEFANEFGPNNESQDAVINDCFSRAGEYRQQAEEKS